MKGRIVLCLAVLSSFGCGAEQAALHTTQPGARIFVNEKFVGLSPTTFVLGRNEGTHYRAVLDGYPPAEGQLETRIAPERVFASLVTVGLFALFQGWHYYPTTYVDLGPPLNPSAEALGGRTNPSSSPEDHLRHVQNMYDQGLINEQEYKRLRSEILHELSPSK
jgi:hypothetical protein